MVKLYRIIQDGLEKSGVPDYVIRDGKVYRTIHHPSGWSDVPDYEIGPDGGVYTFCPSGGPAGKTLAYEFRKSFLYRTLHHPEGKSTVPDYFISDE